MYQAIWRRISFTSTRVAPTRGDLFADDLNLETLFDDRLVIAAGMHSRWVRRRKIDLAELIDEPWISAPPDNWHDAGLAEASQTRGLAAPKIKLVSGFVHLRTHLLASGQFIAAFPYSVLRSNADQFRLKLLPVDLPSTCSLRLLDTWIKAGSIPHTSEFE